MEQREHLRVQIPLAVEITHPSIGTLTTTARDISAGGVFICLTDPQLKVGAKLKVKVLNLLDTDTQHTPSVDMEVKRTTAEGLGLAFRNKTAKHLWASVERLRDELQIGRDYFQVHQSVVLYHLNKGVLLVQQDGKWLLPGHYLTVGDMSEIALRKFIQTTLSVSSQHAMLPIAADSAADISVLEAATFRVIYKLQVDHSEAAQLEGELYKDLCWVNKTRALRQMTFAAELQREAAEIALAETG